MSNSRVKLSITLEGEGEVVDAIAELLERFLGERDRKPLLEPRVRLEDVPPAVSIAPRRRANGL